MNSESLFVQCKGCNKIFSKSLSKCPDCGKRRKKLNVIHWIGICFVGFVLIGAMKSPSEKNNKSEPIKNVRLEDNMRLQYAWTKEGFGSVMEADFVISNNNDVDIKDVKIQCDHFAKSGTKIDSNSRTIYEVVKQKSKRVYPGFNMGFIHSQAVKSSCFIIKVSEVN